MVSWPFRHILWLMKYLRCSPPFPVHPSVRCPVLSSYHLKLSPLSSSAFGGSPFSQSAKSQKSPGSSLKDGERKGRHTCPWRCQSTRTELLIRQARKQEWMCFQRGGKKSQHPLLSKMRKHPHRAPDPASPKRGLNVPVKMKRGSSLLAPQDDKALPPNPWSTKPEKRTESVSKAASKQASKKEMKEGRKQESKHASKQASKQASIKSGTLAFPYRL